MSSRRSRSGGNVDRDGVDAEVEVLAEPSVPRSPPPAGAARRRRCARPRRSGRLEPSRSICRSCRTRSSLTWKDGGSSLISSRNSVPPLAASKRADAPLAGAGEGPLLVAEQLGLDQRLRQRGAADAEVGLGAPRRVVVDRVGHHLLAGAALAVDQDAGVGVGDDLDQLEDPLHLLALADDLGERVAAFELLLQPHVLLAQQADRADVLQAHHQLGDRERLGDEVRGAVAHRLHGPVHRAVGRDHHHGASRARRALIRRSSSMPSMRGMTRSVSDHVVQVLLEQAGPLLPVLGDVHDPAFLAQRVGDRDAQQRLVLDDQQPASANGHQAALSGRSRAAAPGRTTRNTEPSPGVLSTSSGTAMGRRRCCR